MKSLGRDVLDRMHCQVPGCNHRDHSVLFLNQRCHWKAGVTVSYILSQNGVLTVQCAECSLLVANVGVTSYTSEYKTPIRSSPCHPEAGIDAKYVRATGELVIQCAECEKSIGSGKVAARAIA